MTAGLSELTGAVINLRDLAGSAGGQVKVSDVSHEYGTTQVLRNIQLDVGAGEFLALLGASGSGKTTLLRIVGGLIRPSVGRIWVGDKDITELPPEKRDIGFVFQNYALFPHLTVAENVGFALKVRKVAAGEARRRVQDVLDVVGLAHLGHRYPAQLSGGQQQRVALARAIVFRPKVLLLDEPLGALDRQLRQQLGDELRSLQRRSGITMLYVTHDQEEAFTMATQVAILHQGAILQMGAPHQVYRRPINLFVARFVGRINLFYGDVTERAGCRVAIRLDEGVLVEVAAGMDLAIGAKVVCVVRPEQLSIGPADGTLGFPLTAAIKTIIFGGSWHRVELVLKSSGRLIAAEGRGELPGLAEGDTVAVTFDAAGLLAFPRGQCDQELSDQEGRTS